VEVEPRTMRESRQWFTQEFTNTHWTPTKYIVLPVRNKNKQILSWISGFKDSNGDTRIESWVDIELIVL